MKKLPKAPIVKGHLLRMCPHLGAVAILGLMQPVHADITGEIHATTGTTGQTITGDTVFQGPLALTGGEIQFNYWPQNNLCYSGGWDGAAIVGDYYHDVPGDISSGGFELNGGYLAGGTHFSGWSHLYEIESSGIQVSKYVSTNNRTPWGTGQEASPEYYASSFKPTSYWLSQRTSDVQGNQLDHFAYSALTTTGTTPGLAHFVEVAEHSSGTTLQQAFHTWHRTGLPPADDTLNSHFETIAARSTLAMSFGGSNNILKVIHPTNASNFIELNPNSGTISINGQSVLTSASANLTYLTIAQAESGYVKNDSANGLPVGERQALTPNGLPIGLNSYAEENAVSIGIGAGKAESLPASGLNSVSLGIGAHARELGSIAIGEGASATNDFAIAIGLRSSASEGGAVAIGQSAIANQSSQVVLGSYNLPSNPSFASSPTDDLLVVGNGANEENRSNAFVIKRNGDTQVTGKIKVQGEASFQQVVRVAPAGDIGMGEFTSGPQP